MYQESRQTISTLETHQSSCFLIWKCICRFTKPSLNPLAVLNSEDANRMNERKKQCFLDQHAGSSTGQCFTGCLVIVSVSHAVLPFDKEHAISIIWECNHGWSCCSTIRCYINFQRTCVNTAHKLCVSFCTNNEIPKHLLGCKCTTILEALENTSKIGCVERTTQPHGIRI